jgi:hypothetical protein
MSHIDDINNLFSYENMIKDKVNIVTQIGNMFELYRSEDIENLIKLTNTNNLAILNDINITKEFNNLLTSYKEVANVEELVFDNIVLSIKKLYNPKTIELSYRQHCQEIFSLLANILLKDNEVTPFMYELLYQKLLINQLNSEETIDALINNDLNGYISQDKLLIIRPDISNLLKLSDISTFDDMNKKLNDIKDKINLSKNKKEDPMKIKKKTVSLSETDFNENESEISGEDIDVDSIDDELDPDSEYQEEEEFEQENLSKKKFKKKTMKKRQHNLSIIDKEEINPSIKKYEGRNDLYISNDGKYLITVDAKGERLFSDHPNYRDGMVYYDSEVINDKTGKVIYKFASDCSPACTTEEAIRFTWINFLNVKDYIMEGENEEGKNLLECGAEYYPENLSRKTSKMRTKIMKKRQRNLNSSMILEEGYDNVSNILEISPDLPSEMKEEDLIKAIAVELSKQRKLIENMGKKIDRSMNLSKRESELQYKLTQLSEIAEELEDEADKIEEDAKEIEEMTDELLEVTENVENENSEAKVMDEESENLSFRRNRNKNRRSVRPSNLSRDNSHRVDGINLSSNRGSSANGNVSASSILMNRFK